jgi:hypothetical protein
MQMWLIAGHGQADGHDLHIMLFLLRKKADYGQFVITICCKTASVTITCCSEDRKVHMQIQGNVCSVRFSGSHK